MRQKIDPSAYTRFTPGKPFDLGGGRVVNTIRVRGTRTAARFTCWAE